MPRPQSWALRGRRRHSERHLPAPAEAQVGLAGQRAETASQPALFSYGLPWVPDLFWLHSPPNSALPGEAAVAEN